MCQISTFPISDGRAFPADVSPPSLYEKVAIIERDGICQSMHSAILVFAGLPQVVPSPLACGLYDHREQMAPWGQGGTP